MLIKEDKQYRIIPQGIKDWPKIETKCRQPKTKKTQKVISHLNKGNEMKHIEQENKVYLNLTNGNNVVGY